MSQSTGLKRNTLDKFYTSPKIAEKCFELFRIELKPSKKDIIIEPSAGNGVFINLIKSKFRTYKFYDIEPEEHPDIEKQDFLELDTSQFNGNSIHIIGNPPFSRQSSMTIKFIKKICKFADSFSFILPKSFKKQSMQKHIDLYFHNIYSVDLENNSFLVNNKPYDVPCVFQIWVKKKHPRLKPVKLIPNSSYKFVKKTEDPDMSFRRVGVKAGKISTNINKSEQSHYFIKFLNNLSIDENLEKIKNITFEDNNTVGPKSIGKQEIIKLYNPALNL